MCNLGFFLFVCLFSKSSARSMAALSSLVPSFQLHPAQTGLTDIMPRLLLLGDICLPFFSGFVIQIYGAELKTQKTCFLDPFGVRARDPVRTHNSDPRQQSGFCHRITVVKPPLTAWFSISPVKCNVPCNLVVNHYPARLQTTLF